MRALWLTFLLVLIMPGAGWQQAWAQGLPILDVQLATDRASYTRFEPVIVEISLQNTGSAVQTYGPIGWPAPYSTINYRVVAPDGLVLDPIALYDFIDVWAGRSSDYQPGEVRIRQFNLLLAYPIVQQVGTYMVEALFAPPGASSATLLVSTSFLVEEPVGVDASVISALARAADAILNLNAWDLAFNGAILDDLAVVLQNTDTPPHMIELAQYLQALYFDIDATLGTSSPQEGLTLYEEFIADFPESVYTIAAGYGFAGLLTYGGSEPDADAPQLPDLPGAITVASNDASVSFSGGSFTLSGFDHTLEGIPTGSGNDAHGILATTAAAQQSLLDALGGNQQNSVVGLDTPPDIAQGALDFDVAALIDALLALVTDTLTASHTGTLGSVESPVVAYAPGGLTLSGNLVGTGVLIVDGPLVEQGGVAWTGLVIVRADGATPPAFEMRGNVSVTGGVLLYNDSASAASLVITGSAEVRYSLEVFEMLRAALFPMP